MLTLFDYWRSGAGYRVRIALALKDVPFRRETVDLAGGGQRSDAFMAQNPQGFVPAMRLEDGSILTQSHAIIEWLDETFPSPPLLPADAKARAQIRAIVNAIACDIHPINNLRVLQHLRRAYRLDDDGVRTWALQWIKEGFAALEVLLRDAPAGPWAWGQAQTMADLFAVPQIYSGVSRYDLDMRPFPRLSAIAAAAAEHPAFEAAHPERQSDKP